MSFGADRETAFPPCSQFNFNLWLIKRYSRWKMHHFFKSGCIARLDLEGCFLKVLQYCQDKKFVEINEWKSSRRIHFMSCSTICWCTCVLKRGSIVILPPFHFRFQFSVAFDFELGGLTRPAVLEPQSLLTKKFRILQKRQPRNFEIDLSRVNCALRFFYLPEHCTIWGWKLQKNRSGKSFAKSSRMSSMNIAEINPPLSCF